MSALADIEAALHGLSAQDLSQVEAALRRVQRERGLDAPRDKGDVRLDGLPWPKTPQEVAALLAEWDALPPVLTPVLGELWDGVFYGATSGVNEALLKRHVGHFALWPFDQVAAVEYARLAAE